MLIHAAILVRESRFVLMRLDNEGGAESKDLEPIIKKAEALFDAIWALAGDEMFGTEDHIPDKGGRRKA